MSLTGTVLDTPERCEPYRAAWDALAVAEERPFSSPAWMLAWWRHVPGPRAALRVVVVLDGDDLVAVAPFYAERARGRPTRYRMLGAGTSHRAEPLAKPEVSDEAGIIIARELANAQPRPALIYFESVDMRSRWPDRLVESWPHGQRPWSSREWSGPAPTVSLDGNDFDGWLQSKSRNFRSQAGRLRRRLEARGAHFHLASDEHELEWGLRELSRLHHGRWQGRGGSVALNPKVERTLGDAGRELLSSGRFRLVWIEAEGRAISAHAFVAAGGEVSYWNGGFDEEWASEQPSMRALILAIEDACARSDHRLDLGGGAEPYKYRLADGEDILETTLIAPRDGRYPLTRLQLAPRHLRSALSRLLPGPFHERLRRLRRISHLSRPRRP